MKMLEIEEPRMTFGPFPESDCYRIEKSALHKSVNEKSQKDGGIKVVEFLLLRNQPDREVQIWIVEAKSSSPRPETTQKFDGFIQEIQEKFVRSFSLCLAVCLKRHPRFDSELPDSFRSIDLSTINFQFVLVIKGHEDRWLHPLKSALNKALRVTIKIWGLSPNLVAVYNDEMAREYGLIRANQPGAFGEEQRDE